MVTNLALYLLTDPSGFCLTLKTHLQPMAVFCRGFSTRVQVLFLIKESYSDCMAANQVGFEIADFTDLGLACVNSKVGLSLGLAIPDLDLVHIGWIFAGLETEGRGGSIRDREATDKFEGDKGGLEIEATG